MTTSQYKITIIIHLLLIDSILAEALVQYKMFFMWKVWLSTKRGVYLVCWIDKISAFTHCELAPPSAYHIWWSKAALKSDAMVASEENAKDQDEDLDYYYQWEYVVLDV